MKALPIFALVAALLAAVCWQAATAPTRPFDDPLWFTRSCYAPTTPDMAAVDIPAVNRWIWWAALKATGLDVIPVDEPLCWTAEDGMAYFQGRKQAWAWMHGDRPGWQNLSDDALAYNMGRTHGAYAPRKAVVLMRFVSLGVFVAAVAALWWAARRILRHPGTAAVAVLPILLAYALTGELSFQICSTVHILAGYALVLAAWLYWHEHGARSLSGLVIVSALCGCATAAKHNGILALAALVVYLAVYSRGTERIVRPVIACLVAFLVFVVVNPVVFRHPELNPFGVLMAMIERRVTVAQRMGRTPISLLILAETIFWWWPVMPVAAVAAWRSRREWWFPPLALWTGFIIAGTALGLAEIGLAPSRYTAPLQMAAYFAAAVMLLAPHRLSIPAS